MYEAPNVQATYQPWYTATGAHGSPPAYQGSYAGEENHPGHGIYLSQEANSETYSQPPNPMPLYPTRELPEVGEEEGINQHIARFHHSAPRPEDNPVPHYHSGPARNTFPGGSEPTEQTQPRERRLRETLRSRQLRDERQQADATELLLDDILKLRGQSHVFLDWIVRERTVKALPRVAYEDAKYMGSDWRERQATYPPTSRMTIVSVELGDFIVFARPEVGYVQVQDVLSAIRQQAQAMFDALAHTSFPGSTMSGSSASRGINHRNRQELMNHATGSQTTANWTGEGSVHSSGWGRLRTEVPGGRALLKDWKWGGLSASHTGGGWALQLDSAF